MEKVIVSVTNNLVSDQRVERICQSLHSWGLQVLLVGRNWPLDVIPEREYPCRLLKLFFKKNFLFYAEYNLRLFFFLLFRKADILIANDLDTLPANYLIARIKKIRIYFDSHEYFSETPEVYKRKFVKNFWLATEKLFIRGCDGYYTVSSSLADIYQKKYDISFKVVRNVPYRQAMVKHDNGLPEMILYQGSINQGRGLELIIRTMQMLEGITFVIAGNGPELRRIKQLATELNLGDRVQFTGNLTPPALRELTRKASVGISIEEAMGMSYMAALPNKLFDYIQAGVPVLVSDLPEMKAIVEKYQVGEVLGSRTSERLAAVLNMMLNDENKKEQWTVNLEIAAKELCWEREEVSLKEVFKLNG